MVKDRNKLYTISMSIYLLLYFIGFFYVGYCVLSGNEPDWMKGGGWVEEENHRF